MGKFKIDKNLSRRIAALSVAGMLFATGLGGCKKQSNDDIYTASSIESIETTEDLKNKENIKSVVSIVEETNKNLDIILTDVSDEIKYNSSIILLLDLIAKEDENGKINANIMSELKNKVDADNMINEFNAFLDTLGNRAIIENKLEKVSLVLPSELAIDKDILSKIESLLEKLIKYSNEDNKDAVANEYNKFYKLFVEEKELEINGIKFEIRDLTVSSRAVATNYAEIANYYSRNYISKENYKKMDERTNDQNNKAYIKETLSILSNEMEEKSEVDAIKIFNQKYEDINNLIEDKINLSNDTVKNLVNYINLKYIDSDKISTKDKNEILGMYEDDKISDVLLAIDAINKYNIYNQNSIIPLSSLLIENYSVTEVGKVDKIALDFVQYNTIMLNNTANENESYDNLSKNPYFNNIYKYFTKQNFTHIYSNKEYDINWQEISDGTNFVNYQTILKILNKYQKTENFDSYLKKSQSNLGESIQYIQNTIMEECKKVDTKEYIKTK